MSTRILRSARLISVLTLASRVLGLARDMACSWAFGAGPIFSAFTIAFQIPNLFRRLFGEGALTAASVPVLTERLTREGKESLDDLAGRLIGLLVFILGGICLVGDLVLMGLIWRFGYDYNSALILHLTIITLPFAILICITALLGSVQNVLGLFGPPAAVSIILNVFMIGGAIVGDRLDDGAGVTVLAVAVVLSGFVQAAWLWSILRRKCGLRLRLHVDWRDQHVRHIALTMLPMIAGLGAVQLSALLDSLLAYWFVPGGSGPAILAYAQRLYQFPLGVFAIALATAIFPALSRHAAAGDIEGLGRDLSRGLCVVSFEGLPCAIGLILVREPLIDVLFNRGEFARSGEDAAARVAFAVFMYALGIWAFGANQLVVRAYYALGDVKTPLKVSLVQVVVNFSINLFLVQTFLREGGLALASSITASLQVAVLLYLLQRKTGALDWRYIASHLASIVAAVAMMGLAVWAVDTFGVADLRDMLRLPVLIGIGGVSYVAAAWVVRCKELRELIRG